MERNAILNDCGLDIKRKKDAWLENRPYGVLLIKWSFGGKIIMLIIFKP
jgi:hypothetical protein